jgi:hypothetical protein
LTFLDVQLSFILIKREHPHPGLRAKGTGRESRPCLVRQLASGAFVAKPGLRSGIAIGDGVVRQVDSLAAMNALENTRRTPENLNRPIINRPKGREK